MTNPLAGYLRRQPDVGRRTLGEPVGVPRELHVTATSYMTGHGDALITAGTSRSTLWPTPAQYQRGRTWSNQGTLTIAGDDYINFGAYGGGTTPINEYWATLNLSSSAVAPLLLYTGTAIPKTPAPLNHTVSGTHAISPVSLSTIPAPSMSAPGTLSYNRNLTNHNREH